MQKYFFTPGSFCMLRTSSLPINFSKMDIRRSSIFQQALQIATPSLYSTLKKAQTGVKLTVKEQRHLEIGLAKYEKRITHRATPFGLFARISFGEVTQKRITHLKLSHVEKGVTTDFRWYLKVLKKYESDLVKSYPAAKIQANNLVYSIGKVYILDEKSLYGQANIKTLEHRFILKKTHLLQMVMELSKNPITIKEILKKLQHNTKYPLPQLENYIQKLIMNEFLVSELRPQSIDGTELDKLIQIAQISKQNPCLTKKLIKIREQIQSYHNMVLGESEKCYNNISKQMQKIAVESSPLRVDLRNNFIQSPKLDLETANRVVHAVENLSKVSTSKANYPWLNEYLELFIERYGVDQIIPVKKVLDQTFGLGYPEGYAKRTTYFENKNDIPVGHSEYLDDLYQKILLTGEHNIQLTDNDFIQMSKENNNSKVPIRSGEVYFQVFESSKNKDKIVLSNMIGSMAAGNTFGRFWYLLRKEERNKIKQFQNQVPYDDDILQVELSEIPAFGKNGNVMNNKSNIKTKMRLRVLNDNNDNSEELIEPDDVFVGANLKSFYLYSKKYEKKLYFTANNMLNFNYCSPLYRFLFEVSLMNKQMITPISLSSEKVFMPRIEWNDVILRLAAWQVKSRSLLKMGHLDNESLMNFIKDYKMPRYVLLTSGDNQINIDLENSTDKKIIEQVIKRQGTCLLTEDFLKNSHEYKPLIEINNKYFQSEFVLPFKNSLESFTAFDDKKIKDLVSDNEQDYSAQFSRSDWFYVEISAPSSQRKKILKLLNIFSNNFLSIDKQLVWFFINYKNRYSDTVRFRMFSESNKIKKSEINKQFRYLFKIMYENGLASDYCLKRYIPETYRYGGQNILPLVERFFEIDSMLALEEISELCNSEICIVDGLVDYEIMFNLGLTPQKIINNTSNLINSDLMKKVHHFSNSMNQYYQKKAVFLRELDPNLVPLLFKEKKQLFKIKKKSETYLNSERQLRLINSLLHMHSNRVNGINTDYEGEAIALANMLAKEAFYCGQ